MCKINNDKGAKINYIIFNTVFSTLPGFFPSQVTSDQVFQASQGITSFFITNFVVFV